MKKLFILFISICAAFLSVAQDDVLTKVSNWKISIEKDALEGEPNNLIIEFDIADHWYSYGNETSCDQNVHFWKPDPNAIEVLNAEGIKILSKELKPVEFKKVHDDVFGCDYQKVKGHAKYSIPVKIETGQNQVKVKLKVLFSVCTEGLCLPGTYDVELRENILRFPKNTDNNTGEVETEVHTTESVVNDTEEALSGESITLIEPDLVQDTTSTCPCAGEIKRTIEDVLSAKDGNGIPGEGCDITRKPGYADIKTIPYGTVEKEASLWDHLWFMVLAFLGGLTALLTPCVFPMIPMTVTFFTKQSENKSKGLSLAMIYGLFIVLIYTLSGTLLAKAIGASGANLISTHWIPNILFFLIFVLFALSFLGLFEITLPSSWVNASDKKADKGGLIGAFFMALTLVLVSFSCTGPIVSSILIESADGSWARPLAGMLGFSLAFALPFTIFALFPSAIQKLPKSGGWLNAVKVVLGLLELALAFKFLSQVDLLLGWGLLDREIFLAIWIAIFTIIGLYLLGRVKMNSDDDGNKIGVFRMVFAISSFVFVVYLIPGMWGAPLKAMSGLLPPMYTQDFILGESANANNEICVDEPMYDESLHWPHGINGYFDLREAVCCAVQQDKPIFVDFTGHTCANCRKMEMQVWSDPAVLNKISQDFVPLALYGDDRRVLLPASEYYMNIEGDTVKHLGQYNREFMLERFKKAGQPFYLLLEVDREAYEKGEIILKEIAPTHDYNLNSAEYLDFLNTGLQEYRSR